MVWAATAITVGAGLIGNRMQARAAERAAESASSAQIAGAEAGAAAQLESSRLGIEEQRRQFEEITRLLQPYVSAGVSALPGFRPFQEAGTRAFQQQQALSGLLGPEAQRAAISTLEQAPEYQGLVRQGEEALLQRASATGGLRGGNIQAALAQFRPQMLSEQIERQLGRLAGFSATGLGVTGDLANLGQAAAARQAALGSATGSSIAGLLGEQGSAQAAAARTRGAAQAGAALAGGTSPTGQFLSAVPSMFGTYYGLTGQSPFSGMTAGGIRSSFAQTPIGRSGFGTGLAYGNQDIGQFI
jgi:hypothetical protein